MERFYSELIFFFSSSWFTRMLLARESQSQGRLKRRFVEYWHRKFPVKACKCPWEAKRAVEFRLSSKFSSLDQPWNGLHCVAIIPNKGLRGLNKISFVFCKLEMIALNSQCSLQDFQILYAESKRTLRLT